MLARFRSLNITMRIGIVDEHYTSLESQALHGSAITSVHILEIIVYVAKDRRQEFLVRPNIDDAAAKLNTSRLVSFSRPQD